MHYIFKITRRENWRKMWEIVSWISRKLYQYHANIWYCKIENGKIENKKVHDCEKKKKKIQHAFCTTIILDRRVVWRNNILSFNLIMFVLSSRQYSCVPSKGWISLGCLLGGIACDTCMTHASLSRPIKKTNCAMYNLCIAIDIEATEPPLDMRKLSPSMSTRLWNIVFPLGYPLFVIFSLFPLSLSLGFPLPVLFGRRLTIPNSDARYPYRPFASSCFTRDQKTNRNSQETPSVNVVHGQSVPYLGVWKLHGSTCLYRCGYMSGLSGGSRKEHRFSAITGFELRLCAFKYSKDEYFPTVAFSTA